MLSSRRLALLAVILVALLFATSCGSDSNNPVVTPNPAPSTSSISPTSGVAGGSSFTLTVNGTNFISTSTVLWNGAARTTTYVSATQLTASINATDITASGTATVTVSTPTPGGGTSSGQTFTIQAPNPTPTITKLMPSNAASGGPAFTLHINGTGFINTSKVRWNGSDRPTTYVNATNIQAAIAAQDIATAGTATITVFNPAPGGGTTNGTSFIILQSNPVPAISSISPGSTTVGSPDLTLTINGTGFFSGSEVHWNASMLSTVYVSATKLTATVPASSLASTGTANITVTNPAPGGGDSAPITFTIHPPVPPAITSLSPTSTIVGGSSFTLTVDGTGFKNGSIVKWVGSARPTTYIDSTQLTADIAASDVASQGNFDITVENPDHSISNAMTFAVNAVSSGVFERILTSTGGEGNYETDDPFMTPDGRYIVFGSYSNNILPNDTNGKTDIFMKDTCRGAAGACTPSIQLISVATDGTQGNDHGYAMDRIAITPNGRYVVFGSLASNLVPNDTNDSIDMFLRDTCIGAPAGCTPSTINLSLMTDGTQMTNHSARPDITADGRYVVFETYGGNPGLFGNPGTVVLRDTCIGAPAGCAPSTSILSKNDFDQVSDGPGLRPSITDDGAYVVYDNSRGINLVNTCIGAAAGCTQHATQLDLDQYNDPMHGYEASMSADGRTIAFISAAGGLARVYVYDTCIGASGCTPAMWIISDPSGSTADAGAYNLPSVSSTGRYVAFTTFASNLIAGDTNSRGDLYVVDTCIGATGACTSGIKRASLAFDGAQPNNSVYLKRFGITSDGKLVVFSSAATNLVPDDWNGRTDVFLAYTGW